MKEARILAKLMLLALDRVAAKERERERHEATTRVSGFFRDAPRIDCLRSIGISLLFFSPTFPLLS